MAEFGENLSLLAPWMLPLGMILATNLLVAVVRRPWGKKRWFLALFVSLVPWAMPVQDAETAHYWGIFSTLLTTLAIVTAARLPDLDRRLASLRSPLLDTFLWMTLPMVKGLPFSVEERSANRRRAGGAFRAGAIKAIILVPIVVLVQMVPGDDVNWLQKSGILILHFVLSLTAVADFFYALCLVWGVSVIELYDSPLLSTSPRDFWSRRWNHFIARFALKNVARPIARRCGRGVVIPSVFFTSGVFHEYFAWGVAGAGARYGFMLLFFLLQGVAVWVGRRWRRSLSAPVGRLLTFLWMCFTAPLFFWAIEPSLLSFGYPAEWLP